MTDNANYVYCEELDKNKGKNLESSTTTAATLNPDQAHAVYETLKEYDHVGGVLEAAKKKTEETEYTELEEIEVPDIEADLKKLEEMQTEETEASYREVLDEYGVTEEEVASILDLIDKFKAGDRKTNYYDQMSPYFREIADGFRAMGMKNGYQISKKEAAMTVMVEMIKDAKFTEAMNQVSAELNEASKEFNREYSRLYIDAFEETFAKIDEIRAENPEQAEKIEAIKKAFDDAKSFEPLKEFISTINPNKLRKWTNRYRDEVDYFNKKVNATDVKVPNIGETLPIISVMLPQYNIEDIKKFIVAICRSAYNSDVVNNPWELAYYYRLVSNIYVYKFAEDSITEDEEAYTLLFRNIAEVIDCIINK